MRIPVSLPVEYRGVAPAYEFVADDTKELVNVAPRLKFEVETFDGDVEMIELSSGQIDKAHGSPDYMTFKRGDRMTIVGLAVLNDKKSGKDSYLSVQRVEMITIAGKEL